jgi:hypothetical protein
VARRRHGERRRQDVAHVAFAPNLSAEVHLADVAWARAAHRAASAPNAKRSQALSVGDVARFRVLPPEAEP